MITLVYRRGEKRRLREALRFWVERADRFERELPEGKRYLKARGCLSPHYALGRHVSGPEGDGDGE